MTKIYDAFSKAIPEIYTYHFDGEVVIPGETRNGMRSAISRIKERHPKSKDIVYYIFDIVIEYGVPFEERRVLLRKILSKVKNSCIRIVPDYGLMTVNDENV
jgi:ATP-dependent DNA ligase